SSHHLNNLGCNFAVICPCHCLFLLFLFAPHQYCLVCLKYQLFFCNIYFFLTAPHGLHMILWKCLFLCFLSKMAPAIDRLCVCEPAVRNHIFTGRKRCDLTINQGITARPFLPESNHLFVKLVDTAFSSHLICRVNSWVFLPHHQPGSVL